MTEGDRLNSDVKIKITGFQMLYEDSTLDKDNKVTINTISRGAYCFKNHKHYIKFDEKYDESDKNSIVHNTLIINKDSFQILKTGYIRSRLSFTEGERYASSLVTPVGSLYMLADTRQVTTHFEEGIIKVTVTYDLSLNDSRVSLIYLEILIEDLRAIK